MTPEEQRALDWQTQRKRRKAFKRTLQGLLQAPTGRIAQTKKNWAPLIKK